MLMTLAFVDSDEEKFQKMLNMINKNIHDQGQSVILPMPVESSFKRHMRGYRGSQEGGGVKREGGGVGAGNFEFLKFD